MFSERKPALRKSKTAITTSTIIVITTIIIEKYKMLKGEITRMWGMKKVIVIPLVAGVLGAISTGF